MTQIYTKVAFHYMLYAFILVLRERKIFLKIPSGSQITETKDIFPCFLTETAMSHFEFHSDLLVKVLTQNLLLKIAKCLQAN